LGRLAALQEKPARHSVGHVRCRSLNETLTGAPIWHRIQDFPLKRLLFAGNPRQIGYRPDTW